jgi:predicted ArsR family transcriptional regulator
MPGTEPLDQSDLEWQIAAVSALNEPVRRNLYRYVAAQHGAVGRDEAGQAVGISRELAAFHLDKLVELELLVVEFRRLSDRSGPGAGRPAKLYRLSDRQLDITLPERRYQLAAHLLAQGMQGGADPATGLVDAARRFGEELGTGARRHLGRRPSDERLLEQAAAVLQTYGFEPVLNGREIRLRNCPFDALAADYRDLICGMNLALLEGLVAGLRTDAVEARLAPEPGCCCVVLTAPPKDRRLGPRLLRRTDASPPT